MNGLLWASLTVGVLTLLAVFLPSHIKEDIWVRAVRLRYRFSEWWTERRRQRKQRRRLSRYSWADHMRETKNLPDYERHRIRIDELQLEAMRSASTVNDYHWSELYVAHQLSMSVGEYRSLPVEERVAWDFYFLGYFHNKREWRRAVERSFDYFASLGEHLSETREREREQEEPR